MLVCLVDREISEEEAAKRLVPVTITEEDIIQVISDAMEVCRHDRLCGIARHEIRNVCPYFAG